MFGVWGIQCRCYVYYFWGFMFTFCWVCKAQYADRCRWYWYTACQKLPLLLLKCSLFFCTCIQLWKWKKITKSLESSILCFRVWRDIFSSVLILKIYMCILVSFSAWNGQVAGPTCESCTHKSTSLRSSFLLCTLCSFCHCYKSFMVRDDQDSVIVRETHMHEG